MYLLKFYLPDFTKITMNFKISNIPGNSVYIKHDYVSKMDKLLHNAPKFKNFGPASQNDSTAKIESQIQHRLLELKKKNLIPTRVYEAIQPTGS